MIENLIAVFEWISFTIDMFGITLLIIGFAILYALELTS